MPGVCFIYTLLPALLVVIKRCLHALYLECNIPSTVYILVHDKGDRLSKSSCSVWMSIASLDKAAHGQGGIDLEMLPKI